MIIVGGDDMESSAHIPRRSGDWQQRVQLRRNRLVEFIQRESRRETREDLVYLSFFFKWLAKLVCDVHTVNWLQSTWDTHYPLSYPPVISLHGWEWTSVGGGVGLGAGGQPERIEGRKTGRGFVYLFQKMSGEIRMYRDYNYVETDLQNLTRENRGKKNGKVFVYLF